MFGRKSGSKSDKKAAKAEKQKARAEKKKARAEAAAKPKVARPAGPLRKQPTNIYTVLLLLALLSMVVANILVWMELFRYGSLPQWTT